MIKTMKMKQINAGMRTQGFMIATVMTTASVRKMPLMNIRDWIGNRRSNTITSLVKRVRMRPIGFESKKIIFDRRTVDVTLLSILVLLAMIDLNKNMARQNDSRVYNKTRPEKTSGYFDRYCSS